MDSSDYTASCQAVIVGPGIFVAVAGWDEKWIEFLMYLQV